MCVVFRLKRSVTRYFWVNISDPRFEIPGIVEFSNLRPTGDTVVYIPYYMPATHPKFSNDDAFFRAEGLGYLRMLNPELTDDDVVAFAVARLRHAQPVCPPGFAAMLPAVETSIRGLQIADTCFYYPEDRGIAESVRLGKLMAERVR
jgi:protoporphyrinogen oxidase